jgi:hypothetical protein
VVQLLSLLHKSLLLLAELNFMGLLQGCLFDMAYFRKHILLLLDLVLQFTQTFFQLQLAFLDVDLLCSQFECLFLDFLSLLQGLFVKLLFLLASFNLLSFSLLLGLSFLLC